MATNPGQHVGRNAWLLATDDELLSQCKVRVTRRGGPGGQHRNKTSTAVVIVHEPSGIVSQASERRDQRDNRRMALARLRLNMAIALRAHGRGPDGTLVPPGELWLRHRARQTICVNAKHRHFPMLLAQVLDWLSSSDWRIEPVAEHLQVTNSQLVKFLKRAPAAFSLVNHHRRLANAPPIR